ncbi:MAG: S9 family peptidase [Saprospiraceae bacterium]
MKKALVVFYFLCFAIYSTQGQTKNPSFEEVLSLKQAGIPLISPDGKHVLFSVTSTDWQENSYDTEIWLSKNGEEPFQLTNTLDGSSTSPAWSPDGQWISFKAKRGKKAQLHVVRVAGGEAFPVSHVEGDIGDHAWSPDGAKIAFTMTPAETKEDKKRKEKFGAFEEDDNEFKRSGLFTIDFDPNQPSPSDLPCYDAKDKAAQAWDCIEWKQPDTLILTAEFTVEAFEWSPDGRQIAITHAPDPLINSFFDADISLLEVKTKKLEGLVKNPSADSFVKWSPDGKAILYTSAEDDRSSNYYKNGKYFKLVLEGKKTMQLGADFDEEIYGVEWRPNGIFAQANMRTYGHLLKIDERTGKVSIISGLPDQVMGFTLSKDGAKLAFAAADGKTLREVYTTSTANISPKPLTHYTQQIANWKIAQSEVIQWKSKDGTTIEGVLHKPMDYDPTKKYPLLVVIHGGPTGVDRPAPILSYVYPTTQWLNKGALILRVNYRGSAGYGEAFRALNVRNLGVGDAWDVLSGVDYLDEKGLIDTGKMGCMGWSQGGYISAFLTTNTDRFKAISVGAGISNWMTYYVNTDIHPFTRQYLQATPWEDEAIYRKTSPMTTINKARTPTLIQHGEYDQRVPIANAYELLQGLRDVGVTSKLIVYKGFGHGITKPKERLAAVVHNWEWFNQYVFGE